MLCICLLFFKQKTAYDVRISDWSSDVCSSDLGLLGERSRQGGGDRTAELGTARVAATVRADQEQAAGVLLQAGATPFGQAVEVEVERFAGHGRDELGPGKSLGPRGRPPARQYQTDGAAAKEGRGRVPGAYAGGVLRQGRSEVWGKRGAGRC